MPRRSEPTPLDGVDVLLADLDGVVYRGSQAIPGAVEALNRFAEGGRVGYITNNASRTDATVAEHLRELGLRAQASDVVTSPQAAVALLADLVPPPARILVVGGAGLTSEVERAGYTVLRSAEDDPAAVIQGFAPTVGWTDLAEAAFALRAPRGGGHGIPWVATNTDWTLPTERGTAPGNGTLVSAVHTAVGRLPVVAGKPERAIFDAAVERFDARHPLVIGDRLDTDILGANRAGLPSVLVLTGIDGPKQVLAAPPDHRPTFIVGDLGELYRPYPQPQITERRGARIVSSGSAIVRHEAGSIRVERAGHPVDRLRAGATAIWTSGSAIHGLDVDPQLYS